MKKTIIFILLTIIVFLSFLLFQSEPKIRNTKPTGENIICFGNSLTYGTGANTGMDYPSQLSRMISRPVFNLGVPGDTTTAALERLEEDIMSRFPRIVLITLGGNDLKNGIQKEEVFNNLRVIITSIQDRGALVIVGGIDVPFLGNGFGKAYKEICNELGAVLIPNIFEGIIGNSKLMSDRIHPNDAGYAIIAKRFYEALKPYL
ncbi:MAG: GDSL-type esterase/lipase family protein [Thermodesulfobacteriota bacterium]|nr:GDSL-type esterase/lipase family protein [Thermodesulfobacteriota bacterium]